VVSDNGSFDSKCRDDIWFTGRVCEVDEGTPIKNVERSLRKLFFAVIWHSLRHVLSRKNKDNELKTYSFLFRLRIISSI
jgi:hypothetical protein